MNLDTKYPYSIGVIGCFVLIKNGMAGTYKIRKETLAIDGCSDGLSVLCDGSDKSDHITVLDLSKTRTGFNPKITTLYPKNFGFETIEELVNALSLLAERNIALKCCYEQMNELTIVDSLVFCGVLPDEIVPKETKIICFNLRAKDTGFAPIIVDPITDLFALLPIQICVNGLYNLEITPADFPASTDISVLLAALNEKIRAFYDSIPGLEVTLSTDGDFEYYKIKMDLLVIGLFDTKYKNALNVLESNQIGFQPANNKMFILEYSDGTLDYASAGMLANCDFSSYFQTGYATLSEFEL